MTTYIITQEVLRDIRDELNRWHSTQCYITRWNLTVSTAATAATSRSCTDNIYSNQKKTSEFFVILLYTVELQLWSLKGSATVTVIRCHDSRSSCLSTADLCTGMNYGPAQLGLFKQLISRPGPTRPGSAQPGFTSAGLPLPFFKTKSSRPEH